MDFGEDEEEFIAMMAEDDMLFTTSMMTTAMFYLTKVTLVIHYVFSVLLRAYHLLSLKTD